MFLRTWLLTPLLAVLGHELAGTGINPERDLQPDVSQRLDGGHRRLDVVVGSRGGQHDDGHKNNDHRRQCVNEPKEEFHKKWEMHSCLGTGCYAYYHRTLRANPLKGGGAKPPV